MAYPAPLQYLQQPLGLLGHRYPGRVQVIGTHRRNRPGGEHRRGDLGEPLCVDTDHHLGQQLREPFLQRHRTRVAAQGCRLQLGEHLGDVLERAVLQQAGEQQIAHLQKSQILGVLHLTGGQQAGGLEVQQRGRNHQEGGGLIEFQLGTDLPGVGDEIIGHLVQSYFGDVEPVGEDQLQQQVERTLEVGQPDPEALLGRRLGSHLPKRSMTSRASVR